MSLIATALTVAISASDGWGFFAPKSVNITRFESMDECTTVLNQLIVNHYAEYRKEMDSLDNNGFTAVYRYSTTKVTLSCKLIGA